MSERRHTITIANTLIAILVLLVGYAFYTQIRLASKSAEASALSALVQEIHDQLAAIPPGGSYPESLSELPLTYPDGGDISLLEQIDYRRIENGCEMRVRIFDRDNFYVFPDERLETE